MVMHLTDAPRAIKNMVSTQDGRRPVSKTCNIYLIGSVQPHTLPSPTKVCINMQNFIIQAQNTSNALRFKEGFSLSICGAKILCSLDCMREIYIGIIECIKILSVIK